MTSESILTTRKKINSRAYLLQRIERHEPCNRYPAKRGLPVPGERRERLPVHSDGAENAGMADYRSRNRRVQDRAPERYDISPHRLPVERQRYLISSYRMSLLRFPIDPVNNQLINSRIIK